MKSSLRRISARATITATYEAAFTSKQTARPTVAMSTPPIAGPMTLAPFMTMLFRLTAFGSSSEPTISTTNDCRVGLSNMFTNPSSKASRKTCQSRTDPGNGQDREHQSQHARGELRSEQDPPLVEAVRDQTAPCPEQQHRQELESDVRPRSKPSFGTRREPEHQPGLRDALHPGAADRDRLPDEPQAGSCGSAVDLKRR